MAASSSDYEMKINVDIKEKSSKFMTTIPDSPQNTLIRRISETLNIGSEEVKDELSRPERFEKNVFSFGQGGATVPVSEIPSDAMNQESYRETAMYILGMAAHNVFPTREFVVVSNFEFKLRQPSYYCRFVDHSVTKEEVAKMKEEMDRLVSMKISLESRYMSHKECRSHFTATHQSYSLRLVDTVNREGFKVVGCKTKDLEFWILGYVPILSNTKYVTNYSLFPSDGYFVLSMPDAQHHNLKAPRPQTSQAIKAVYKQGVEMGKILKLQCVGDLNDLIQQGRSKELILLSEAFHDMQIVNIARQIYSSKGKIKIILISGPSSSGKTTFASKLGIQLRLLGLAPLGLEVDMYFKDRDDPTHPFDSNGVHNFEVIEAMRVKKLNEDIHKLLKGETVRIPNFSFKDGKIHGLGKYVSLADSGVLILEGIFCLNPRLTFSLPNESKFRIFMCPISFYNLDNYHFLSEQIIRLIRRISRDHRHRNKKADFTIFKWGHLQGGEDENIFPFVGEAHAVFNSALGYELPVLKVYSKPLIQTVKPDSPNYTAAKHLLSFLHAFLSMSDDGVPRTSLITEFCGNSIFEEMN